MSKKNHIALLMMLKNEEKRLHVSLESVVGVVDSLIIYDTGSTDRTISILKEFSEKNSIPLRLKEGELVNFSESRNVSLDFADTFLDVDYLLLLDCNDVLRGGENLLRFARDVADTPSTGFLITQEWWSGQYCKYFNLRFCKVRKGWRYKGSVHEYMAVIDDKGGENRENIMKGPDNIILYQDRTQDDDKTGRRFVRDKELLLKDYEKDPNEPRMLFYLAQTCGCLDQLDDAMKYYKLRVKEQGFFEEIFHAYLRLGEVATSLKQEWSDIMGYYMQAFEKLPRAEPLVCIGEYYFNKRNWHLSYMFINLACSLEYPHDLILFVDKLAYTYKRWHLMALICLNFNKHDQGKDACLKAIEGNPNAECDKKNLELYENIERSKKEEVKSKMTKNEFIDMTITDMKKQNPKEGLKKLTAIANLKWKKYRSEA